MLFANSGHDVALSILLKRLENSFYLLPVLKDEGFLMLIQRKGTHFKILWRDSIGMPIRRIFPVH